MRTHHQPQEPTTGLDLTPIDPQEGECVLCFAHRAAEEQGCDGTLRWVDRFREVRVPAATALARRMAATGWGCDCEVVGERFRLVRECLERDVHDDELRLPAVWPTCSGVRRSSAQPCRNWERRGRATGLAR